MAAVFAALGDPTRLTLMTRLNQGESRSITQLTVGLGLTRQGITRHLRVMEEAGLVISQRVGRESRYRFNPQTVDHARDYLARVSLQWDEAIQRLQQFLGE